MYLILILPKRIPDGFNADLSPGHVFLLTAIETTSNTRSTFAPSSPNGRKSSNAKCVSVPPETNVYPFS